MHNVYSREYMAYWIFDFPRIYRGFCRAVLRSVSLRGGFSISQWVFSFPISDFSFPNMDFLCRIRIFCAEHRMCIAPGLRGTEGLPFPFSVAFPVAFPVALAIPETADQRSVCRPAEHLRSVCVAWAEHESRSGAVTEADRRPTAGPLQSPSPSRPFAYSSSVEQAHIVRGRAGYQADRRRARAWMV